MQLYAVETANRRILNDAVAFHQHARHDPFTQTALNVCGTPTFFVNEEPLTNCMISFCRNSPPRNDGIEA